MLAMNGYPNNFWGWGGEDDELRKRLKEVGLSSVAPPVGSIEVSAYTDRENEREMHRNYSLCLNAPVTCSCAVISLCLNMSTSV